MNQSLIPVTFHDDTLYLVEHNQEPYTPARPICDALGVDWKNQHTKLQEPRWKCGLITTVAQDGKKREMLCLPLRKLPGWLMSISPAKVKPEVREKLERYQDECDDVLWRYWNGEVVKKALSEPPTITKAQAGELAALVAERAGDQGKPRAYYWSRFNNHFRIARYRDLPAEKFDEAVEYIRTMPDEQGNKPALLGTLTATGGRMTVLMTIEGDRITHMQPLGEGEVVIDPAKLPDNIHALLPGWRLVPVNDLDTLTRLALASLELFDGIETMKGKLRETAEKMRQQWVH